MGKTRLGIVLAASVGFVVWVAPEAFARGSRDYHWELFGNWGYGTRTDDETGLGNGVVLGGGAAYRFAGKWGVVLEGQYFKTSRNTGRFSLDGSSVSFAPAIHYYFSRSEAQPYIRAGWTMMRYSGTHRFENLGVTESGSHFLQGLDLGFGVKFFAKERLSISPELRYSGVGFSGYDPYQDIIEPGIMSLWFTMGVGYHF